MSNNTIEQKQKPSRASQINAKAGIYWTLKTPSITLIRKAYGHAPGLEEAPHDCLGSMQCATPKELLKELRILGWTPASFSAAHCKYARIQITVTGFEVAFFPDYAAAVADDRARAKSAEAATPL